MQNRRKLWSGIVIVLLAAGDVFLGVELGLNRIHKGDTTPYAVVGIINDSRKSYDQYKLDPLSRRFILSGTRLIEEGGIMEQYGNDFKDPASFELGIIISNIGANLLMNKDPHRMLSYLATLASKLDPPLNVADLSPGLFRSAVNNAVSALKSDGCSDVC